MPTSTGDQETEENPCRRRLALVEQHEEADKLCCTHAAHATEAEVKPPPKLYQLTNATLGDLRMGVGGHSRYIYHLVSFCNPESRPVSIVLGQPSIIMITLSRSGLLCSWRLAVWLNLEGEIDAIRVPNHLHIARHRLSSGPQLFKCRLLGCRALAIRLGLAKYRS